MSSLISCPHCAHQIHESAPSCPQCGATRSAADSSVDVYTSYDQVPWYRKRWALILAAFIFMPLALLIAFTGDVYLYKDGKVQKFPKHFKFTLLVIFAVLVLIQMSR